MLAAVCPAQTPVINDGGVVNAADYTPQVAPGMIVSIFGTELAPGCRGQQQRDPSADCAIAECQR